MTPRRTDACVIRFGVFELDLAAGQLRKNGVRIKLQEQPFQVLAALLEKPGELVSRDELKERLWAGDTFVDFDRGLNTAVNKIREVLGDSASTPRFVETQARRGYRFLAPVDRDGLPDVVDPHQRFKPTVLSRWKLSLAITAVFVLVVGGWGFWVSRSESGPERPRREFTVQPRGLHGVGTQPGVNRAVISPDGRYIAYRGAALSLWVYDLSTGEDRKLEGVEHTGWPSWSPDSRWICFVWMGRLFKVSVDGGAPQFLAEIEWPGFLGSSWSPDGRTIVFSAGTPARLYELPSKGGVPQLLFEADSPDPDISYANPHFAVNSSRGRLFLYRRGAEGNSSVVAWDLDTGERQEVVSDGGWSWPFHSNSGHLLLRRQGQYFALPFSAESLQAQGDPIQVGGRAGSGSGFASVSLDGTLVHEDRRRGLQQLAWVDRRGDKIQTMGDFRPGINRPRLSPDGRRIVMSVRTEDSPGNLWVYDLARNSGAPLTFDQGGDPVWTPDSARILYTGLGLDIFITPADGSGIAEPFLASPDEVQLYPYDVSRDGYLVYVTWTPAAGSDIFYVRMGPAGRPADPVAFVHTRFDEMDAALSPDGALLAYVSDESGRYEVYLQPFPAGGWKEKVSTRGGSQPRWRGDGKELFFVEDNGGMVAVSLTGSQRLSAGERRELFRQPNLLGRGHAYDVSPDGQQFVIRETVDDSGHVEGFRIVQNWSAPYRD